MSTNKDTGHHSEYVPLEDQKIINVEINKEMRKSFLDYSMSVIVSRALPDVRDGLKPGAGLSRLLGLVNLSNT